MHFLLRAGAEAVREMTIVVTVPIFLLIQGSARGRLLRSPSYPDEVERTFLLSVVIVKQRLVPTRRIGGSATEDAQSSTAMSKIVGTIFLFECSFKLRQPCGPGSSCSIPCNGSIEETIGPRARYKIATKPSEKKGSHAENGHLPLHKTHSS